MLVQTCNTPPSAFYVCRFSTLHSDRYSLCAILQMKEDQAYLCYGQCRGSHPAMPKQSDERSHVFFFFFKTRCRYFCHAPSGSYSSPHPFFFLPSFQNRSLSFPLFFPFPFFFSFQEKGNEGELGYSAQESQGCDFHCEVLKVTVHS